MEWWSSVSVTGDLETLTEVTKVTVESRYGGERCLSRSRAGIRVGRVAVDTLAVWSDRSSFVGSLDIRILTVSVICMPFLARTQSKSSNPTSHNGKGETKL